MIDDALLGGAITLGRVISPIGGVIGAVNDTLQYRQANADMVMLATDKYNVEEGNANELLSGKSNMLGNSPESERQNRNLIPDALALSSNIYCVSDESAQAYHTRSFYEHKGWIWINDYFKYPNAFPEIDRNQNFHKFLLSVKDEKGEKYIDKRTGLVSGIFFQYVNNRLIRIAYVTKGTTPTSPKDWGANLKQGLDGNSALYQKSLKNASFINAMFNQYIRDCGFLYFFGHSLGGGLANYNAMTLKKPSVTFNAASVHPDSVIRNIKNYQDLVKNKAMIGVYVEGEVLSNPDIYFNGKKIDLSNSVGLPKNGNRYKIELNPIYYTNGGNMIERHLLEPLCLQYGLIKINWKNRVSNWKNKVDIEF